jgi:hypothetical protein
MPLPAAAQRVVLATLARQLESSAEPVYADLARLGATLGLVGNRHMRQVATAAVRALGRRPTAGVVWRFGWQWWYQRSVDELLAYQADRLTPEWAQQHVLAPPRLPPASSILLSVHQYNLPVAAARAVQLVDDLGVVSMIDPRPPAAANAGTDGFLLAPGPRARVLGRFYGRTFGGRLYTPMAAARQGLELLQRGGSLIVLADFYGQVFGPILGKRIPVAQGPVWLARRSGRPIVPFVLIPPRHPAQPWRLWCGEPIDPSPMAVAATLEAAIRRLPTTWMSWRGWHAAPAYPAAWPPGQAAV